MIMLLTLTGPVSRAWISAGWLPLAVLASVSFSIVPPEPAVLPVPVTVSPPAEPVFKSRTGSGAPPADVPDVIDWKMRPGAPIAVLSTSRASPVWLLSVFVEPVTYMVSPPVAAKALSVAVTATVTPPVKSTVAPGVGREADPCAAVADRAGDIDRAARAVGDVHRVPRRAADRCADVDRSCARDDVQAGPAGVLDRVPGAQREGVDRLFDLPIAPSIDPLLGLALVAGWTTRLGLGANVVPLGRNPFLLAKKLAQLERISNGRLLLSFVTGIGARGEREALGLGDAGAVQVRDRARCWR